MQPPFERSTSLTDDREQTNSAPLTRAQLFVLTRTPHTNTSKHTIHFSNTPQSYLQFNAAAALACAFAIVRMRSRAQASRMRDRPKILQREFQLYLLVLDMFTWFQCAPAICRCIKMRAGERHAQRAVMALKSLWVEAAARQWGQPDRRSSFTRHRSTWRRHQRALRGGQSTTDLCDDKAEQNKKHGGISENPPSSARSPFRHESMTAGFG